MDLTEGAKPAQLAKALGQTTRSVTSRVADGRVPVRPDGLIDVQAMLREWWASKSSRPGVPHGQANETDDIDALRAEDLRQGARKKAAEAERVEMLNAQMRGDMVLSEDMERGVGVLVDAARARILAMPTKITPLLVGKDSPQEVKEILTDAAHECCADLAAGPAADAVRARARERAGRGEGATED